MLSMIFLQLCALGLVCFLLLNYVRDAKTNNVDAIVHDATRERLTNIQRVLNAAIALILAELFFCSVTQPINELVRSPELSSIISIASSFLPLIPATLLGWAAFLFFRSSGASVDLSDAILYLRKEGLLLFIEERVLVPEGEAAAALSAGKFDALVNTSQYVLGRLSSASWIWRTILNNPAAIVNQLRPLNEEQSSALLRELLAAGKLAACTHNNTRYFMVPGRREKLRQSTDASFKAASDDEILTAFVKWASCQAIVAAIVGSTTPVEHIGALLIEPGFREKLRELSIELCIQPILPDDPRQLEKIDSRIVVVKRASDQKECLAAKALVDNNPDNRFEKPRLFWRTTTWKDVP